MDNILDLQLNKQQENNYVLVLASPIDEPDYKFELDLCLDDDSNLIIDPDFICEYKLEELIFLKIIQHYTHIVR